MASFSAKWPVFTESQNEWPAFSQKTRPNGQFFHREPDQTARHNSISFISWSVRWDQKVSIISKTAPDSLLLTLNGQSLAHLRAKDKVTKSEDSGHTHSCHLSMTETSWESILFLFQAYCPDQNNKTSFLRENTGPFPRERPVPRQQSCRPT